MIEVRSLCHTYRTAEGPLRVLEDVDLDVASGEFVAITGPSGVGKTTLLSLIGGLDSIQEGDVRVAGRQLAGLGRDELAEYRRATVGFVFQDYGLLDVLTAAENVELALTFAGLRRAQRRARAEELLDAVGLAPRASHRPPELSGGENQRVSIARALANSPRLVLADEPTGNLDDAAAQRVLALLRALPAERGCTVVVVTHNEQVARLADREVRVGAAAGAR